jgi:hypothetical protein
MSAKCCDDCGVGGGGPGFKCVLWAVLAINASMLAVEIGAGFLSGSAALAMVTGM